MNWLVKLFSSKVENDAPITKQTEEKLPEALKPKYGIVDSPKTVDIHRIEFRIYMKNGEVFLTNVDSNVYPSYEHYDLLDGSCRNNMLFPAHKITHYVNDPHYDSVNLQGETYNNWGKSERSKTLKFKVSNEQVEVHLCDVDKIVASEKMLLEKRQVIDTKLVLLLEEKA